MARTLPAQNAADRIRPRSRCRDCERPLPWRENVPVVSWIALRGRCAGCGGSSATAVAEQSSTLKPLAVLYGRFQGEHRGQPPANEAEFKAYAQTSAKPMLDALGIQNVDSLFVSNRDNQPYVVLYGPLTGPPGKSGQPVFAYEKVGVNGHRLVATSLGDVQEEVRAETERLRTALAGGAQSAEDELLGVAASLLRVEDHLDERLVRLVVEEPEPEAEVPEDEGAAELRSVHEALLRECLVDMARVRDAISERLAGPIDPQVADAVPEMLKAVTAALLVIERPRAVAVLERIADHVRDMLQPGAEALQRDVLDRLAAAIVSLEYYMETIQAGRKDPVFMLENAECIVLSAIDRKESRGAQYRTDFPERNDEEWLKHIDLSHSDEGPEISYSEVTITQWEPQERTYLRVILEGGRPLTLYRDGVIDRWFEQRYGSA